MATLKKTSRYINEGRMEEDDAGAHEDFELRSVTAPEKTISPVFREEPRRWLMLVIYCLVLSVSYGGLGPIGISVDSSQKYYGLDNITFNVVFLAAFADFAASMLLWNFLFRKFGLVVTIRSASLVSVAGYVLQLFYKTSFWFVVAGGVCVDTSRAMIWCTTTTFIARWFSSTSKSLAYGMIFALAAAFSVSLFLSVRLTITTPEEFDDRFLYFVITLLCLSAGVALLTWFAFREAPDVLPGPQTDRERVSPTGVAPSSFSWILTPCRANNRKTTNVYLTMYLLSVVGTWSASALLLQIMDDHDYTQFQITVVGIVYAAMSLPTPIVIGKLMDVTRDYRSVVTGMVLLATIGFAMFWFTIDSGWVFYLSVGIMAFSTGAYSISFAECITELAFPLRESDISMFMFFFAQFAGAGGTILASFPAVINTVMTVFMLIYLCASVALVVDRLTPIVYRRLQMAEEESRTLLASGRYVEARD